MKKYLLVIPILAGTLFGKAQSGKAPYRLRCERLLATGKVSFSGMEKSISLESASPQKDTYQYVKIIEPHPALDWELEASVKQQSAYRILLATSSELLNKEKPDMWDTKKVHSGQTHAVYSGKPLVPGTVYHWKVQYWQQGNKPSAFSANASFYFEGVDTGAYYSHYPLQAEMQSPVAILPKPNGDYFLDFGKDAFAQILLHINSPVTDSIWIEAAEALSSPGELMKLPGNIRYAKMGVMVKKGEHDYVLQWPPNTKRNSRNPVQMPTYIGEVFPFRYVTVLNCKGTINPKSVQRKVVSYRFEEDASYFMSSDSILNKVWDLCKYSIKATSFTGFYVDGDRERLPYEADALINQLSHYAVDAEYSMARRSMAFLLFHPTWPTEWSLQNILLAWNDYLYTGDDAYLKKYYSELQKKILMPLAADNGLISTTARKQTDDFLTSIHMMKDFDGKHGLKDNVDWPQKGDYIGNEKEYRGETDGFVYTNYNSVINAYYYHCLGLMQKIAQVLQKPEDAVFYQLEAARVYRSFREVFSDAATGLIKDGDTTNHSSLHANMFALAFGLVPKEDAPAVIAFIKTRKMACSVYGAQFLLEALYDAGQDQYALDLMRATSQRSWYNMIRVGSTITMEAWDKVYKPNLDLNHAWGSAPANIIVRKLMGIEPVSPGGENIRIKPQMGDLSFAKVKTTLLKGSVSLDYSKTKDAQTYLISIPGTVSADIMLPANKGKYSLWMDGKEIQVKSKKGLYTLTNVPSGNHLFELRN